MSCYTETFVCNKWFVGLLNVALNTAFIKYFPVWKDVTMLNQWLTLQMGVLPLSLLYWAGEITFKVYRSASAGRFKPHVKLTIDKPPFKRKIIGVCSAYFALLHMSRASPRTHVTSDVAPPTYFCKPPCVWKYGGSSDTTSTRPKFTLQLFTWKAMNEHVHRGVGNEDIGGRKRRKALAGRGAGPRTHEFPGSLFTSLIEVPLVRVPPGKRLRKTGRVDAEVFS